MIKGRAQATIKLLHPLVVAPAAVYKRCAASLLFACLESGRLKVVYLYLG